MPGDLRRHAQRPPPPRRERLPAERLRDRRRRPQRPQPRPADGQHADHPQRAQARQAVGHARQRVLELGDLRRRAHLDLRRLRPGVRRARDAREPAPVRPAVSGVGAAQGLLLRLGGPPGGELLQLRRGGGGAGLPRLAGDTRGELGAWARPSELRVHHPVPLERRDQQGPDHPARDDRPRPVRADHRPTGGAVPAAQPGQASASSSRSPRAPRPPIPRPAPSRATTSCSSRTTTRPARAPGRAHPTPWSATQTRRSASSSTR